MAGTTIGGPARFYRPFNLDVTVMSSRPTGAEDVRWDLTDLYPSEAALRTDLVSAEKDAQAFAEVFHGKIAQLNAVDLREALEHFERAQEKAARAATYAYLNWSTATQEATRGALLQHVREACSRIHQLLLFFDLEWMQVDTASAEELLAGPELDGYRHYLERERLLKPYSLTEPEEKILREATVTGSGAWMRFFTETLGGMRFELRGESLSQQHILAKLYESDRELRRDAAISFTEGLKERAHVLTYVFNTLVADKASRDRLRGFPHWIKSRHLANEISDETAQALIDSVTGRYDLVARYYTLKRKVLGLSDLVDYDRYAPVGEGDTFYSWAEARELTLESYSAFHPKLGDIAEKFFSERWIDAPVAVGKQGGAFSHGAIPNAHPYVLVNFTGRARDVQTLAHELGHGVHQYLARKQGLLQADTPLTTAETASVFGEMLVFQNLLARESTPRTQLSLLMGKIDDTIATVFRQIAMNRFEDAMHRARRSEGELSAERLGEIWLETQSAMFQGSVTLGEHYRHWWSYIPHFLHTPGYVYAYAFGELLVLALYARYQAAPADFPDKYVGLLAAGGSDWPHVLVSRLGIDLQDPVFWQQGLQAIEDMITRAEALYAAA